MSLAPSQTAGGNPLPDWLGASVLDTVNMTYACPASWDAMQGSESVRFCAKCQQHVYDLSQMTRAQAEALVVEKEGRLCLRFYRRADGRIVTRDCQPKSPSRKRYWLLAPLMAFIALVVFMILRTFGTETGGHRGVLREVEPFRTVMEWIDPTPPPPFVLGW